MKRIWALLLMAMLAFPAGAGAAVEGMVMALGTAPVGDNQAMAKENAVAQAIRNALTAVALDRADAGPLRRRLDRLQADVLERSQQYVSSFSIETTSVRDKQLLALVKVSVDLPALDRALLEAGLKLPTLNLPPVLLLVREQAAPGRPPAYWWSGPAGPQGPPPALLDVLNGMGVRPAPITGLRETMALELRKPQLSPEEAVTLAHQAGVELVLLGQVRTFAQVTSPDQAPEPVADLTLLNAADGQILAASRVQGPVFHQTPGPEAQGQVTDALEQALRELLARAATQSGASATTLSVPMEITGLTNLGQLATLTKELAAMPSLVKDFRRQSMGGGRAVLMLNLLTQPERLADQLLVRDYGNFLLNVTQSGPQGIKVVVLPKQ